MSVDEQSGGAEDWLTFMHDNARSGVTTDCVNIADLSSETWVYTSPAPPQVAWGSSHPWDAYHVNSQVPMRDFDFAFHVTVLGDNLYFGSSVTDSVHCLDVRTGLQRWFFRTDGAVRYPPAIYDGKLYFGSDDGYAYCIDADDASLVWKFKPTADERLLSNNGKMIPMYPIRTGTAVVDGKVYFAASLVPWEDSYLCAVDAQSGSKVGEGLYVTSGGSTPMGAILASSTKIYLMQGNRYPHVFNRLSGSSAGTLGTYGDGGCYALLTSDTGFAYGHGQRFTSGAEIREFGDKFATVPDGRYMVVNDGVAYILYGNKLEAMVRDDGNIIWSMPCDCSDSLVMAENVLYVGGQDQVKAFDKNSGQLIWSESVSGRARGLAVAGGRLFVSTDLGYIHMFGSAYLEADFNKNGNVDLPDLLKFANEFLDCTDPDLTDCVDLVE